MSREYRRIEQYEEEILRMGSVKRHAGSRIYAARNMRKVWVQDEAAYKLHYKVQSEAGEDSCRSRPKKEGKAIKRLCCKRRKQDRRVEIYHSSQRRKDKSVADGK